MNNVVAIVVDGVWVPISGRHAIDAGNDFDMTNSRYTEEEREAIHRRAKAIAAPKEQQLPVTDGHCAATNSSTNEVDQIAGLLGQIIRRTKSLSEEDARRVREFIRMTQAVLTATTCLPEADQKIFEAALRDATRNGY
jgi:hypothetical protein